MKKLSMLLHSAEIITNHVVGKQHTVTHRRSVGAIIMVAGVWLAHAAAHYHILIALPLDAIGYSLHAIGFVPFIKSIENADNSK